MAAKYDTTKMARSYISMGWAPVPSPCGQKSPRKKRWQKLLVTSEDVPKHFESGDNVGLLLGKASGDLIDIDVDAPEAVDLDSEFLPPTDRVHGRRGKPLSHWWYLGRPSPAPLKLCDIDGTTLVELRSTGQQTLVPPSVHPGGERLRWASVGTPDDVRTNLSVRCWLNHESSVNRP